jgi:predicted MPP superfamily phosphohydrolase
MALSVLLGTCIVALNALIVALLVRFFFVRRSDHHGGDDTNVVQVLQASEQRDDDDVVSIDVRHGDGDACDYDDDEDYDGSKSKRRGRSRRRGNNKCCCRCCCSDRRRCMLWLCGCCIALPALVLLLLRTAPTSSSKSNINDNWFVNNVLPVSQLSTERVRISVQQLRAAVRVVQISDIHWRPRTDERTRRMLQHDVVAELRRLAPDVLVITGDLFHDLRTDYYGAGEDIAAAVKNLGDELLSKLPRAPLGTFAVRGNHDGASTPQHNERMRAALARYGVTLLVNEATAPLDASNLVIVGLDNYLSGNMQARSTLCHKNISAEAPRLVLSHNPDGALSAVRADVILSGHTHGGQMCLPSYSHPRRGAALLRLFKWLHAQLPAALARYVPGQQYFDAVQDWSRVQGLHRIERTRGDYDEEEHGHGPSHNVLYINRGLVDIYKRAFCPPEVTLIELVPATPNSPADTAT